MASLLVSGGAHIQNLVCVSWKVLLSPLPLSSQPSTAGGEQDSSLGTAHSFVRVNKMVYAACLGILASNSAVFFLLWLGWQVIPLRILTEAEGGNVKCLNHTAGWPWLWRPGFLWLFWVLIYAPAKLQTWCLCKIERGIWDNRKLSGSRGGACLIKGTWGHVD